MSVSLYLVEDDSKFSSILLQLLRTNPAFEVLGHALTAAEARQFAAEGIPDIYLVDLALPDGNGIDLIRHLTRGANPPKVLAMSTLGDEKHIMDSLHAGASGYLHKSEPPENFINSIFTLVTHGGYLSPHASRVVIDRLQDRSSHKPSTSVGASTLRTDEKAVHAPNFISPKEQQVLQLLQAGLAAKLIADRLNISIFTVNQHLRSIYRKLNARNKMEAVTTARSHGFL